MHNDYVIVYFHQGLNEANKPSIQFLWNSYKDLDRNFRKNLKKLYVVHPTLIIRFIWNFFRPFISEKFKNKLVYISSLDDLRQALGLNNLKLPENIYEYVAITSDHTVLNAISWTAIFMCFAFQFPDSIPKQIKR